MTEVCISDYTVFSERRIEWSLELLTDYAKKHSLSVLCIKEKWGESEYPGFMEILLDETIADSIIVVKSTLLRHTGTVNRRLKAKQCYELLLRLSKEVRVCVTAADNLGLHKTEGSRQGESDNFWESIRTDCYIIAKYRNELLKTESFNAAVEAIIESARAAGTQEQAAKLLESMLMEQKAYRQIDGDTSPILVYKGQGVCYNILNTFADQFAGELEKKGQRVEYFDPEREELPQILNYIGRRFKAVIGIQSYLFSIKLKDETEYVHNLLEGPKYNFIFDHPVWMKHLLEGDIQNYHLLALDKNYVRFIQKYYHKDAIFFPPPGMEGKKEGSPKKKYRFSFVGTWGSYRNEIELIRGFDRNARFLANRYLLIMKQNPNMTAEDAFERALQYYGIDTEHRFMETMYEFRRVIYCIIHYYREKVVQTLLDAGICLDVFGDSWTYAPFQNHENLVCRPSVTVEEGIEIMSESELTLNVMSWHKAGFTERIANAMLGKTVVVTDRTDYLVEEFQSGEDMLLFDLTHLEELPDMVKAVQQDREWQKRMTENAYKKANTHHTWEQRAEAFLKLLERMDSPTTQEQLDE